MARSIKRGVDLVGAATGLLVLGAPLVGLMVLVWLQDGGAPLFLQQRVGLQGRRFRMWKLRSMRVGAETELPTLRDLNETGGLTFKLRRDPRVTALGSWLRRTSLDELPQLVNVLVGDMSLVGPRPGLPDEVAAYSTPQHRRLSVPPGMTGLWQISGRSALPFELGMALDLHYVDHWSLGLDLIVLWRTLPAVWRGTGAW